MLLLVVTTEPSGSSGWEGTKVTHYSDVIMDTMRLKSPASRLFAQPFIPVQKKKTSKLRITGLCEGNSPVTVEFPAQWASDTEMVPFDDVIVCWINKWMSGSMGKWNG